MTDLNDVTVINVDEFEDLYSDEETNYWNGVIWEKADWRSEFNLCLQRWEVVNMKENEIPTNDFARLCIQVNEMEKALHELRDKVRELEAKHEKDIKSLIDYDM